MKEQTNNSLPIDFLFSISWEVCNKVGGIYTVLSSQAKSFQKDLDDSLCYIGPDLGQDAHQGFQEKKDLLPQWAAKAQEAGVAVRIGRWLVPGKPIALLVNPEGLQNRKDEIYSKMWADYRVDSLHGYGDYDEACMFSVAAGILIAEIFQNFLGGKRVVCQAHEWMSGMGMLYVKKNCPQIGTVFTTHATSIGRSIVCNNKDLYQYFQGYRGDQMAEELNMQSKHSVEKAAAQQSDCFTTVSELTNRECRQLLERDCDVILPNGFENSFVPSQVVYAQKREKTRAKVLSIAGALLGKKMPEDTLIISTSGRNDFRCKGYELFVRAMVELQKCNFKREVLAILAVPCWKHEVREDLCERLSNVSQETTPLPNPFITHTLYNWNEDAIVQTVLNSGLCMQQDSKLHLLVLPTYLDGNDGLLNETYYDWLTSCDLCAYPSYYEPWGYTPMESMAFGIPTLTTNLAGFGIWIEEQLGREATLNEGIVVVHRDDTNTADAIQSIVNFVLDYQKLNKAEIAKLPSKCKSLAKKALWKTFKAYYYEAFSVAIAKACQRTVNK